MAKPTDDFGAGKKTSFDELRKLSETYSEKMKIPADAPMDVKVFEVMDKIATAKVTAAWGVDYLHLVKEEGQWKILQVVWQSEKKKMMKK